MGPGPFSVLPRHSQDIQSRLLPGIFPSGSLRRGWAHRPGPSDTPQGDRGPGDGVSPYGTSHHACGDTLGTALPGGMTQARCPGRGCERVPHPPRLSQLGSSRGINISGAGGRAPLCTCSRRCTELFRLAGAERGGGIWAVGHSLRAPSIAVGSRQLPVRERPVCLAAGRDGHCHREAGKGAGAGAGTELGMEPARSWGLPAPGKPTCAHRSTGCGTGMFCSGWGKVALGGTWASGPRC